MSKPRKSEILLILARFPRGGIVADEAIQTLIQTLDLRPHPEGGYYRETYRSPLMITASGEPADDGRSRHACTAIYYLLTAGDVSRWHRVQSDEIWHFYQGDPLALVTISPQGALKHQQLGIAWDTGAVPQIVVPAGYWQAARVEDAGRWTLVGCTVAPGFEFVDFELGDQQTLLECFPQHREILARF